MRRVFAIAVAGASVAGCSSFSSLDYFKPTPQPVPVQLESAPPGADAVTSLGPACKTPCTLQVAAPDAGFTMTFNLPRFQPATIPVQVIRSPGDFATPPTVVVDPSPVFAELRPAAPPPRAKPTMRPKRPKKPKPAAAAPAEATSPFPAAPAAQPAR